MFRASDPHNYLDVEIHFEVVG
ncbi:hypothetical protein MIC448_1820010 [Microbacterium sp. C448]|nr:hypothetical protein MIC448_1820010 [Microbacterium sp. C448]